MGFRTNRNKSNLVAEINVTPLVDVMLVLLIIFMITAPMMTEGLDVNLPEATTKSLTQKEDPIIVTIKNDGSIYLGDIECSRALLIQQLGKAYNNDPEQQIFLKADKNIKYGKAIKVMADIKSVGFAKLGMITKPMTDV